MLLHRFFRERCLLRHRLKQKIAGTRGYGMAINMSKATDNREIIIGDVHARLTKPKERHLIPHKYVTYGQDGRIKLDQTALHHLRWMLQKDSLKQDMFLLGVPGPQRRQLVMQFLEIMEREFEYVALSRDTTESDIKQRREIHGKSAEYHDQAAVRAALHGRVLVLDGIEHAERNVLPVLNNLLENREMHLETGQFLIAPNRYDNLLKTHSQQQLKSWGLLRVSEHFRIVAIGLPTHKYKGTPLDPPLRSRFQSRNILPYTFEQLYEDLQELLTTVSSSALKQLLTCALILQTASDELQLPDFPLHNLRQGVQMMERNPLLTVHDVLISLYPYKSILLPEQQKQVDEMFTNMSLNHSGKQSVQRISSCTKDLVVNVHLDEIHITMPCRSPTQLTAEFVDLPHQRQVLAALLQAYAVGDVCLLGNKGVGKETLITELLRLVNQIPEPMMLYEDLTSRDLIQQRVTNEEGDTIWRDSPLIRAAKTGSVAILSGLQNLHRSTVPVLQRLIHDREIQLCDGTTLLRQDRYQALLQGGFNKSQLTERGVLPIPDSFRIIALGEPLKSGTGKPNWLTPQLISMFIYQELRPLQQSEEQELLIQLCDNLHPEMLKLLTLAQLLRNSKDSLLHGLADTLSTRRLVKVARRLKAYPSSNLNNVHEILQHTFLIKFMPSLTRTVLEKTMMEAGIEKRANTTLSNDENRRLINVVNNKLRIGETEMDLGEISPVQQSKVPSTLFYDMPQHVMMLERLLQDFLIGEHLLLVGNQGVGKNKLIDRLLELMRRPREYLQLHRDTTVHSLTVQSTLHNGKVVYQDSALVKAVKLGHVLVIDEADKAPVNVSCILRTLVGNGKMVLSDGRMIVPFGVDANEPNLIETHKDFRVIVLANRPGFPFLGNDFFAAVGDVFSCHAIENPTPESEIYLLQRYGPTVPIKTLTMLVNAFGELRSMADEGLLNYPYSMREVVSIVKHLERFPDENMSELVGNVFDFDRYQPATLQQVTNVLAKHGLPIDAYARNEMQTLRKQQQLKLTIERHSGLSVSRPKFGKLDPKNEPHVGGNTWAGGSGGRDTAGLGGKGGPFRFDKSHTVYQLTDEEKADIPEEIKQAARAMNRKLYEQKLQEIKMSAHDHRLYAQFSEANQKQVLQLKNMLETLQSKSKERQWQKYQTYGDVDDTRLIEGITGEKNIYRRRTEANPWTNNSNEKPNRLKLVVDVSGSMYRFNGYDGRLDRQLEAVVMIMEAFEGYEKKIVYDIVGHSGEGWELPFVNVGNWPKNDRERFDIIRMMHAHSQFCWPGDTTVKAAREACSTLGEEVDYDNSIVVVLSDANLARYGISSKDLAEALNRSEPKVKGYVIFIGSLAEEAERIKTEMPVGQSYVCMDLTKLPQILNQMITTSLL
ncbi:von Willebrand factor A domain-containing protein 8 isoform X2 [Drosophila hydei]|nr:von Willebrand factor A domain-containing protein 8 isoform X2 [Drosophila hydei]